MLLAMLLDQYSGGLLRVQRAAEGPELAGGVKHRDDGAVPQCRRAGESNLGGGVDNAHVGRVLVRRQFGRDVKAGVHTTASAHRGGTNAVLVRVGGQVVQVVDDRVLVRLDAA